MTSNHDELYREARIYDVAFSYRDFDAELDFLVACARRWGLGDPRCLLDVAAGPGLHALRAAQRGMRAVALDLSASMMELCANKARAANVPVTTLVADMTRFDVDAIGGAVDLAFCPLTSISYMRSADALVEHMRSMARAVVAGGLYVVENNHPKDFILGEHWTPSVWTMSADDVSVTTTWIAVAPPKMDVSKRLYEAVGRYVVVENGVARTIEDRAWLRMTFPEDVALSAHIAGFDLVAHLGDLDVDRPLDDAGWRAVTVLRRRSSP